MSGMRSNNFDVNNHPFLGHNYFRNEIFDEPNNSGEYTLQQGQVVARDPSTGKIVIMKSGETGGKQIPLGVVAQDVTMAGGATDVTVPVCVGGEVLESIIKLDGTDTLDTEVVIQDGSAADTEYQRTIRDMIEGETKGIHLIADTQLTNYGN